MTGGKWLVLLHGSSIGTEVDLLEMASIHVTVPEYSGLFMVFMLLYPCLAEPLEIHYWGILCQNTDPGVSTHSYTVVITMAANL